MAVNRMGADRRHQVNAQRLPKSPEYLARQAQRVPTGIEQQELEGMPPRPPAPTLPGTVVVTCPVHERLVAEPADCEHDAQEIVERVRDAHFLPYGGDCPQPLTVTLRNADASDE